MKILSMTTGSIGTNCYLLYDEDTKDALVIDPSDDAGPLTGQIEKLELRVQAILLTHGHYDHGGDVDRIRTRSDCPVYLHPADLTLPAQWRSGLANTADLSDGMVLPLLGTEFRVLHTPGHTPGSVCFLCGELLFSGDTLFAGSCGRTDLPGGSGADILRSLRRLAELPGNYTVCPGHGELSTLNQERQSNFYIAQAMRQAAN